jgi:hypothetical protein
MNQRTLRIPGAPKHTGDEPEATLQEQARDHAERHPGIRFLADVLRALHRTPDGRRNAKTFFGAFAPRAMMEALSERPDLRVRVVKAMTGTPSALLRRLPADAVAAQIDLLAIDDLPEAERGVRAEADRILSVHEIYQKYLDPMDIATYFSPAAIWRYEAHDEWWKSEANAGAKALMAAELRSVRRNAIMTDAEILDLLGDETLERHLSLSCRTSLRKAARKAAAEGKPFTDADMFAGPGGGRDLIDEMVDGIPLPQLRELIAQVIAMIGLRDDDTVVDAPKPASASSASPAAAAAAPPAAAAPRVGPKASPPTLPAPGAKPGKSLPHVGKGAPAEEAAPPQPDDDLAFVEEVSGRI